MKTGYNDSRNMSRKNKTSAGHISSSSLVFKWDEVDIKEDKEDIIINTINDGSLKHWRWIISVYGISSIRKVLKKIGIRVPSGISKSCQSIISSTAIALCDEALTAKAFELFPLLSKFKNFYLAGGTALVLHIGHRLSVDFDLFSSLLSSRNY